MRSLERSPEVYHVLHEMDATGVDLFIDCHGDEELPHNFFCAAHVWIDLCTSLSLSLPLLQALFILSAAMPFRMLPRIPRRVAKISVR